MLLINLEELHMNGKVGDWYISDANDGLSIYLRYPVNDEMWVKFYLEAPELNRGDIVRLPLSESAGRPVWQWNGNRDAPTLMPSINVVGRWHGWLRDGKLINA